MSKVLLVDTGFSAGPIYSELCHLGYEVHVVGVNPNDCLAKSAKYYWNIDYSDTSALEKLIDREGYNYLVPGCTDRSYSSCAQVNKGRFPGIESIDVDIAINNKAHFRAIAQQIGLQVPQVQNADQSDFRWPMIVKPVDAFSGKGITVIEVEDREALSRAIEDARNASSQGEFLIEDYVVGELHSHSAFLVEGRVMQDFIVQENSTANQFVVDTSRVVCEPSPKLTKTLRQSIEILAKELKLMDGLIHTQFIVSKDNVWLIEITRRCPGDLYSKLIELSTGYPYVQSYISPFIARLPIKEDELKDFLPVMRHTVTVKEEQIFMAISFKQSILSESWTQLSLVGDLLKPSPLSRVGIIFASANNDAELNLLYEATLRRDLYMIHGQ
jgi:formate-dependent phosphoribosylglycinamide formyltransferase (GAR transformylase)